MPERTSAVLRRFGPLLLVVLAGCTDNTSPPRAADMPAPAFDLALVKSKFRDECADPNIFDELFCDQVRIGRMKADGTILIVPTTLYAIGTEDRAAVICDQIAIAHFDGATGEPFGFDSIGVLYRDGGHAAVCQIRGSL